MFGLLVELIEMRGKRAIDSFILMYLVKPAVKYQPESTMKFYFLCWVTEFRL